MDYALILIVIGLTIFLFSLILRRRRIARELEVQEMMLAKFQAETTSLPEETEEDSTTLVMVPTVMKTPQGTTLIIEAAKYHD